MSDYQFNEWWEKHSDKIFSNSHKGPYFHNETLYDWFKKCWERARQELWLSVAELTPKEIDKGIRSAREDRAIEEKDEKFFDAEQEELQFRQYMHKKMLERLQRESETA